MLFRSWERLSDWTQQQRDALYVVFSSINGIRTVENIIYTVHLPADLVEELLLILLELNVIMIYTH